MGIDVEYDDDKERRRTHPFLMLKMELIPLQWDDTEVLKKVEIIVPGVNFKKKQSKVQLGQFWPSKS